MHLSKSRLSVVAPIERLEPRLMMSADSSVMDPAEVVSAGDPPAIEAAASTDAPGVVARIINGDVTAGYPAVGIANDQGTGTLIAPNVVLTAAHVVEDWRGRVLGHTAGTFEVDGEIYHTVRVIRHPGYRPSKFGTDAANDIAIMVLDRDVDGVTPIPIFRGTPTVGQALTIVGFGEGGDGDTGGNGDFGVKRVGQTPIDAVTSTLIHWTFDDNSESNTAPGDSGGPALVQVGGAWHVAGVTSGGTNFDSSIGDESYDTRVDAYADWIDAQVAAYGTPVGPMHLAFKSARGTAIAKKFPVVVENALTVAGMRGSITSVGVTLTVAHKRPSDLSVALLGPDGTSVQLLAQATRIGKKLSLITLTDDAAAALPLESPPPGTYQPDGALSDFDGGGANGRWGLRITDHVAGFGGKLTSWTLRLGTDGDTSASAFIARSAAFDSLAAMSALDAVEAMSGAKAKRR